MKHAMKLNLLAAAVGAGIAGIPHDSRARDIDLLFSRGGDSNAPQTGVVQVQLRGLTQLRLGNGATASFVDAVRYRINEDDSIELIEGAVTVSSGDGETIVRLPDGLVGTLGGKGNVASFHARVGEMRGHVMGGKVHLQSARGNLALAAGQFWAMRGAAGAPERIIAMGAQAAPSADGNVQDLRSGGVVAAAGNGLPVTFAGGLAAAGASADLVAAANRIELALVNPSIRSFPSGDFALLIQHSARLAAGYGDAAFPGAAADIVRTYLGYLANGGSGAEFLTVYARIMTQYLDLLRISASPSGYSTAQLQDIRNFIAYQSRIGGFATLSASNRALVEAYWSFLQSGGDVAKFGLAYTDLVSAYFAYVRGGGVPANFGQASQQTLNAYVKFLGDTGLLARLGTADRTLLQAYLQGMAGGGDGLAFITQYRQSLSEFYLWLEAGNLPSTFTATKIATLKSYLDLLDSTGLWNTVLGERAAFYREYYAYVRANADADLFPGLAAFSPDLYASQLNAYYAFLAQGGLPSAYTTQDPTRLAAYLRVLIAAGKLDAVMGEHAAFFRAYYDFVAAGNDPSKFTQLPVYVGTASAIQAYFAYLDGGGIPTAYTALTQAQVRAYLDRLASLGWWGQLTTAQIAFLKSYSAYLATGANPDLFNDLPSIGLVFANYTAAINAYLDFLSKGGLPSAYTAFNVATLQTYIAALIDAGKLDALFGDKAVFLRSYHAFVTAGNDPSKFTQLPVFAGYASAIQAYFAYLDGGGVPTAYTTLTQEQIRAYLAALSRLGWWGTLGPAQITFLQAYYTYLAGGGTPDGYSGLPSVTSMYASYTAAVTAYLTYLRNGGLPSGYTAVDMATLQKYLAALIDAGKLDAAFGDQAAFLRSYHAYVAAGNDPSKFTQLPVYASYASAIQAYFAYLNSGGVPTAYTALTQEQIRAYLAALSQLGWWGVLTSSQITFLQAYYTYLAGGGNPDTYAQLPGNTTPTAPTTISINAAYAMGRQGTTYGPYVGSTGTAKDMKVDANGVPTEGVPDGSSILAFDPGTATSHEHTVTPEVTVGRFSNVRVTSSGRDYQLGPNQGLHYAYVQPVTAKPTSGTIRYDLAAATKPTWSSGALLPGTFTGTIVVGFESTRWRAAMEGSVTMPGDATYNFATAGGLAGLSGITRYTYAGTTVNSGVHYSLAASMSGTGRACSAGATCLLNMSMMLGGNGANGIAAGYGSSSSNSSDDTFVGAAGFKAAGPYAPPTTPPTSVDMAGFAGKTLSGYRFLFSETGKFAGSGGGLNMNAAADASGLTGVTQTGGGWDFLRGSGTVMQAGAASDVIAWSRWSKGWTKSFSTQYPDAPLSLMVYKPVTSMPTSGTVTYELIGGLDPIWHTDPTKIGKLTGRAAVAFGSSPKVGFDLTATFSPTEKYVIRTAGGIATPGVSLSSGNPANPMNFSDAGAAGCSGTCDYYLSGNLAGAGASHIGLYYNVSSGSATQFSGFAAFAKGGAASTGTPGTAPVVARALPDTPVVPTALPGPGMTRDWNRWEMAHGAAARDAALSDIAPEMEAAIAPGALPAAEMRSEAMARVERMFGGTLTFQR